MCMGITGNHEQPRISIRMKAHIHIEHASRKTRRDEVYKSVPLRSPSALPKSAAAAALRLLVLPFGEDAAAAATIRNAAACAGEVNPPPAAVALWHRSRINSLFNGI